MRAIRVFALFVLLAVPIPAAGQDCTGTFTTHGPFRSKCATYDVRSVPSGEDATSVELAFAEWSGVLGDIEFVAEENGRIDVSATALGFVAGRGLPDCIVDDSGASYVIGGVIELSTDVTWGGDAGGSNLSLTAITVHEIGHILIGSGHFTQCQSCVDLGYEAVPTMIDGLCEGFTPAEWSLRDGANAAMLTLAPLDLEQLTTPSLQGDSESCDIPSGGIGDFEVAADRYSWTVHEPERLVTIRLEAGHGSDGPWSSLVEVPVARVGPQEAWANRDGRSHVRLVAQTVDGVEYEAARLSLQEARPRDPSQAERLYRRMLQDASAIGPSATTTPAGSVHVFASSEHLEVIRVTILAFWSFFDNFEMVEHDLESFPAQHDARREAIRQTIRDAASDLSEDRRFLLVGDASEHTQLTSQLTDWYPSINHWDRYAAYYLANNPAENDAIPTFFVADPRHKWRGVARTRPYLTSDLPYADIDDDGLPDVPVTRWPVSDREDLINLVWRTIRHNRGSDDAGVFDALVSVYDTTPWSRPPIYQDTQAFVDNALAARDAIDPRFQTTFVRATEAPSNILYGEYVRDNHLQTRLPSLLVLHGSVSHDTTPAATLIRNHWVESEGRGYFFPPETEAVNGTSFVIAASCEAGAFASNTWARFEEFMFRWNAGGAIAWTGPSFGSSEPGNAVVSREVAHEVTSNPRESIAISWTRAMRRAIEHFEPDDDRGRTVRSYSLLGDPLSPLIPRWEDAVTAPALGSRAKLEIQPNPFNTRTTIALYVPKTSRTKLRIYDTRGRLVRELLDGVLDPGKHAFLWNGTDHDGRSVASGVYLLRSTGQTFELTETLVLVR